MKRDDKSTICMPRQDLNTIRDDALIILFFWQQGVFYTEFIPFVITKIRKKIRI